MDIGAVKERIRLVLSEQGSLLQDISALGDDDDLFDAGLSSLGVVRLAMGVEESFQFVFPDAALSRGAFSSIQAIAENVLRVSSTAEVPQHMEP